MELLPFNVNSKCYNKMVVADHFMLLLSEKIFNGGFAGKCAGDQKKKLLYVSSFGRNFGMKYVSAAAANLRRIV